MMAARAPELQNTQSPVDAIASGIRRLARNELELLRRKQQKARELMAIEQNAGAKYLSGKSTGLDSIPGLRAELEAIASALPVSRMQRLGAIANKVKTEAGEVRNQITALRSELSGLEVEMQSHLDALCVLERIPIAAGVFNSQPGYECKSQKLRNEIAGLERTAGKLDAWTLPPSGQVDLSDATDPEELVLAVLVHASDSPTSEAVLDWVDACQAVALRRRGDAAFGDKPRRFFLIWKDGAIDFDRSHVFLRDLCHTTQTTAGARYDIESGTFRAEGKSEAKASA